MFATIKFQNQRLNGHAGLKKLMGGFLEACSQHVVKTKSSYNPNTISIDGYCMDTKTKVILPEYLPFFESQIAKKSGKLDYLRKNHMKIKTIIRKSLLQSNKVEDISLLNKMLKNLGIIDSKEKMPELQLKFELPIKPTKQQVDDIIDKWRDNNDTSSWSNVGFKLKGDEDINWLSHSLVKDIIHLDVSRNENSIISAASILNSLTKNREYFLENGNK